MCFRCEILIGICRFQKFSKKDLHGYVNISTKKGLKEVAISFVHVTGTSNLIMASIFAKGTQYIKISIEPEVIDLINF